MRNDIPAPLFDDLAESASVDVVQDPVSLALVERDGSCERKLPQAIARPKNPSEIAAIYEWSRARGIVPVFRGGGTGQAGSSLTTSLLVDLGFHFRDATFDQESQLITAGSAATIAQVEELLLPWERTLGLNPHLANRSLGGLFASQSPAETGPRNPLYSRVASMDFVTSSGFITTSHGGSPTPSIPASHGSNPTYRKPIDPFHQYPGCKPQPPGAMATPWSHLAGTNGLAGVSTRFVLTTINKPRVTETLLVSGDSLGAIQGLCHRLEGLRPSSIHIIDKRLIRLALGAVTEPWLDWADSSGNWAMFCRFECNDPGQSNWLRAKALDAANGLDVNFLKDPLANLAETSVIRCLRRGIMGTGSPNTWRCGWNDFSIPLEHLPATTEAINEMLHTHGVSAGWEHCVTSGRTHIWPVGSTLNHWSVEKASEIGKAIAELVLGANGGFALDHGLGCARRTWEDLLPKKLREYQETFKLRMPAKTRDSNVNGISAGASRSATAKHALSKSPFGGKACTGCGECRSLNPAKRFCPVNAIITGDDATPRSKAYMAEWFFGQENAQSEAVSRISGLCNQCRMCETECPSGLDIPGMMLEIRQSHAANSGVDRSTWLFGQVEIISLFARSLSYLFNPIMNTLPIRIILEKLFGIARQRKLPAFSRHTFIQLASKIRKHSRTGSGHPKIAYFVDVFANHHDTSIGMSFLKLVEDLGFDIVVPPRQKGSGMGPLVQGDRERALESCKRHVHVFAELAREGCAIVCTEPTAALFLRKELPRLLPTEDARLVASRAIEAMEWLSKILGQGHRFKARPIRTTRVSYHIPCHVKALSANPPGFRILAEHGLMKVEALDVSCSGMAGPWGMIATNYQDSLRIGKPMLDMWKSSSAQVGATECSSCRMQMEHVSDRNVRHPIQLLAWSLGLIDIPDLHSQGYAGS